VRTHTVVLQIQTEAQSGREPTHHIVGESAFEAVSNMLGHRLTHRDGEIFKVKACKLIASGSRKGFI